jgi:UDP-N-acetylmuramoyl-L-alanyl-D-glutamate--2,6-diaminopimelate ligase
VLQGLLADLRDQGRRAVAMEVSSHALAQHRVDGIVFDVAAFTNLSHDHLDHHATMDAYFAAKASLFEPSRARLGVVNVDDPWGERLWRAAGIPMVPVRRSDASDISASVGSIAFRWRGRAVTAALGGLFNVDNALMAASIASALEVEDDAIVAGLARSSPVPGRMEVIDREAPFPVVVDFAHTPAGLEVVLASVRPLTSGRIICVFGCGGNRDRAKRPLMGEVADRLADVAILTSDNPRDEDPSAIIDDVRAGMHGRATLVVEPDRRAAIGAGIGRAHPGDLVLIAGKGHERTQTVGDRIVPFDDRDEARNALARWSPGGSR